MSIKTHHLLLTVFDIRVRLIYFKLRRPLVRIIARTEHIPDRLQLFLSFNPVNPPWLMLTNSTQAEPLTVPVGFMMPFIELQVIVQNVYKGLGHRDRHRALSRYCCNACLSASVYIVRCAVCSSEDPKTTASHSRTSRHVTSRSDTAFKRALRPYNSLKMAHASGTSDDPCTTLVRLFLHVAL